MPIVTVTLTDSPTTPAPDSFVSLGTPWACYGEEEILEADQALEGFGSAAVLRLPIEALPRKAAIRKATLKLWVTENEGATVDHYLLQYLLSQWEELAITFGLMPGRGNTFLDTVFPAAGNWKELDITEAVKEWYLGKRPNFGFIIVPRDTGDRGIRLASKEHEEPDYHPQLVVEYLINPARKEFIPER